MTLCALAGTPPVPAYHSTFKLHKSHYFASVKVTLNLINTNSAALFTKQQC